MPAARAECLAQSPGQGAADGWPVRQCKRSTVRNLKVVQVDAENHLLLVRGAVPGPNGGFLVIRETNKVG